MGRTPTWNNSIIKPVRVPQVFGSIVKRIARELDSLEADQELVFIYKLKHPEALKTEVPHKAAEMVFKVTKSLDATALQDIEASAITLSPEAEDEDEGESTYVLNLTALVSETEATSGENTAGGFDAAFDADTVIDQMFFCNEEDAPSPAQAAQLREAVVDIDIDAWQQAIGTVELANGTQTSTVVRPEEDGLLDLSELSTLFAQPSVAAAFDPDTVIESVLANEEPQKESDNFDPDAVFTSLEEQDLDEAAPIAVDEESAFDDFDPDAVFTSLEEQDLDETAPTAVDPIERDAEAIEIEAETEQPSSEVGMTTTCLEAEAEDVKLPRLIIPSLQPLNQSFFASQLFDTWQRLARQKLLEQKRLGAEPWGMAVELNQIYQAQFAAMMGSHFLQRVQDVVLAAPADGKSIQLIATPGIVNQRVAGVDANAISYVLDRGKQSPAKPEPVASHTKSQPSQPSTLRTQPLSDPHLESERARLLKERQRRMEATTPKVKPQHWLRQILSF